MVYSFEYDTGYIPAIPMAEIRIGRDLLNHLIVTLNGLAHLVEVTD
jgi:hypothetical protein